MAGKHEPADWDLARLFDSGDVVVDTWPASARRKLNVEDPLVSVGAEGVLAGKSYVAVGVPGDGKSHQIESIRDVLSAAPNNKTVILVSRDSDAVEINWNSVDVVMLTDVSALSTRVVCDVVEETQAHGLPLIMAINEGPLDTCASIHPFFRSVQEAVHSDHGEDSGTFTAVDLTGRQMIHSRLGMDALVKVLENVVPCVYCGDTRPCARVRGAQALLASDIARERFVRLLALAADSSMRMTPRDIWFFYVSLFFDVTCPPTADEFTVIPVYWWNCLFEGTGQPVVDEVARVIKEQYDPVMTPRATDTDLWRGSGQGFDLLPVGGSSPKKLRSTDEIRALRLFESFKREAFFFDQSIDADQAIRDVSIVGEFQRLLDWALAGDEQAVLEAVVSAINRFRTGQKNEDELLLARHHKMNVVERPSTFLSSAKHSIGDLELVVPHVNAGAKWPTAGFRPRYLIVRWSEQPRAHFVIDFSMWVTLSSRRTLAVDRNQEAVDNAIDELFAHAPVKATLSARVCSYEPSTGESHNYKVSALPSKRQIEEVTA